MPEISMSCAGRIYRCEKITVAQYRRYAEIMEISEACTTYEDAIEADLRILSEIIGAAVAEMREADAEEVLTASKEIHFVMQEAITEKFVQLSPQEPVEVEKSAFDEYDEENGYNEPQTEAENYWRMAQENTDRVVKICIRVMNNSYQQCMDSDIMRLLDYVAFEIRTIDEGK